MTQGSYVEKEFTRDTTYIEDRITSDGSSDWPVEPGRYRLVVSRACPWANRTLIVRRLLGLEDAISLGIAGPTQLFHKGRIAQHPADAGKRLQMLGAAGFGPATPQPGHEVDEGDL